MDDYDDESEEFFESAPKDENEVLDRSAFYLIAKEPVLSWLHEAEKKKPQRLLPMRKFEWTLDKVNSEPTVFLMPMALELWPQKEQNKIWKKSKSKAFEQFLEGFYADDSYWPPHLTGDLFDSWFDIKPLGLVVDLAGDL